MQTELNRQESFSFDAMPSPNIQDLPKARQDHTWHYYAQGSYLTSIHHVECVNIEKQSNNNNKNKQSSVETK